MPDIAGRRFIIDDGHDGERVAGGWARVGQHCTLPLLGEGAEN